MYKALKFPRARLLLIFATLGCVLTMGGCLSRGSGVPVNVEARNTPEAAVRDLMTAWSREGRPLVNGSVFGQTLPALLPPELASYPILGVATFTDLNDNAWPLLIYHVSYFSDAIASVSSVLQSVHVTTTATTSETIYTGLSFLFIREEGNWKLDNFSVSRYGHFETFGLTPEEPLLPPVLPVNLGVKGYVTDSQGKPIQNAAVAIYQGSTLIESTLTDASGYYLLAVPAPGTYTVTAAKDGFEFFTKDNVVIQ